MTFAHGMSLLGWILWMVVRQRWARFRERAMLLSEVDVDRLIGLLAMPGFAAAPAMSFPREVQAARRALTRVRLGADVDAAFASLWYDFAAVPSDIVGLPGPVRTVLVHETDGFWTAFPWSIPASVAEASRKARKVSGVVDADFEESEVAT